MTTRKERPERVRIRLSDGGTGTCSREQATRCHFTILEDEAKPVVEPSEAPGPASPAQIRAWAKENNLPCPKKGRIPASVEVAYHDAH